MSYTTSRRFPASTGLNSESQIGYVFKLAVSADERSVAVATQDQSIRLIDVATLSLGTQISPAHGSTITDLQAVPLSVTGAASGALFMSASADGTSAAWDLRQQVPVMTMKVSPNGVDAPVFASTVSETGTVAVSCSSNIILCKFGEWRKFHEYTESHFDTVSCLQFSRLAGQADILLSGGDDGMVNVFNTTDLVNEDDGQCPVMTLNVGDSVRSLHLSPSRLFVFSTTESVSVWDTATGGKLRPDVDTIRSHPLIGSDETGWGYLIGMDSECSKILAGNSTGTIVEFDSESGEVSSSFTHAHTGVVRAAAYLRNGQVLTAGEDGVLCEWSRAADVSMDSWSDKASSGRSARAHASARPY